MWESLKMAQEIALQTRDLRLYLLLDPLAQEYSFQPCECTL